MDHGYRGYAATVKPFEDDTMKRKLTTLLLAAGLLAAGPALSSDIKVKITNLTNATYFTPLLFAAHSSQTDLFETGTEATTSLQAMAEGGDTSLLINDVLSANGEIVDNPAGGLLAPGDSAEAKMDIENRRNKFLSVVAMLLPTNDGFVGLDSLKIPKKPGKYTYYLNAYDAGTEANDEIINGGGALNTPGVPADPSGNGGSGAVASVGPDHNPTVHIHRGVVGDTDPSGGHSDLDSRVHQWQNPVARIDLTVRNPYNYWKK
jgi:hypothetical protein